MPAPIRMCLPMRLPTPRPEVSCAAMRSVHTSLSTPRDRARGRHNRLRMHWPMPRVEGLVKVLALVLVLAPLLTV